ncbi:MAG: oligosaccharide flippase family protein, partial [Actinomycetota bacterium]|nr:oligosaccharide flippase family protein [Actinomycetota bacterium]
MTIDVAQRPTFVGRARRRLSRPILLALAERLVNRGASAFVTFAMSVFVSPKEAGAYALGMLALTFATGVGSWALQQVGVSLWRYDGGGAALTRLARIVAVGSAVVVLAALLGGEAAGLYGDPILQALLPLVLVAFIQAWFVPAVTLRQFHGQWGRLTRAQTIGSGASLVISLPLLAFCGVAAAVLQTVIAEGIFVLVARRKLVAPAPDRERVDVLRRYVLPTVLTTAFGWANGQADRLVVALLVGSGPLGLLAMAVAVAKTATDAVLNGVLNVLRFRLASARTEAERSAAFSGLFLQASALPLALQIVVSILSVWPLHVVLAHSWYPALAVVPLLAMSGVAMSAQYTIAAAVVEGGQARRLRTSNVASLVLTVGAGAVLAFSLPLGAVAEAVADLVVLIVVLPLMRGAIPRSVQLRFGVL